MAELLIIIGVTTIIVATLGLMNEASQRGHSAVFFLVPLASLGQVQGNWEYYRWWALARVAGVLTAAVGIALYLATGQVSQPPVSAIAQQSGQVQRGEKTASTTAFVNSEEAALLVVKGQGKPLSGRLHGEPFRYQRVALIDGVLTISQGDEFLPELEVRILVGWKPEEITERRTLLVTASLPDVPVVHLSWKTPGNDYPETRIFSGGYRMELALAPLDAGQLSGSLSLVMPDSFKSYLSGDFTAHTNHLRYRNGKVDVHFDHEDTLGYVSREYLKTQFPEGTLANINTESVILRRADGAGKSLNRIVLADGAVQERTVRLEKSHVGWSVVPGSMTTREVVSGREGDRELLQPEPKEREQPIASIPPPLSLSFAELVAYSGRAVTLQTQNGDTIQGVLGQVSANRLWVEIKVGSGMIERSVSRQALAMVTLADGQRVLLPDHEGAGGSNASDPDAPAGIADKPSGGDDPDGTPATATESVSHDKPVPVSEETRRYRALQGKEVTIHARQGPVRTGVLRAVEDGKLTLSVPVGAGSIEFFYDLDSIDTIEATR